MTDKIADTVSKPSRRFEAFVFVLFLISVSATIFLLVVGLG